jgi:hypothetical protein
VDESTDFAAAEPPFRVVTRGLSAGELAAVTVVVEAAVQQELEQLHSEPTTSTTAWQRSQRSLRTPLHPGPGVWRSFSA